jgi:hypothetical protein
LKPVWLGAFLVFAFARFLVTLALLVLLTFARLDIAVVLGPLFWCPLARSSRQPSRMPTQFKETPHQILAMPTSSKIAF